MTYFEYLTHRKELGDKIGLNYSFGNNYKILNFLIVYGLSEKELKLLKKLDTNKIYGWVFRKNKKYIDLYYGKEMLDLLENMKVNENILKRKVEYNVLDTSKYSNDVFKDLINSYNNEFKKIKNDIKTYKDLRLYLLDMCTEKLFHRLQS